MSAQLDAALDAVLDGLSSTELERATQKLITTYRSGEVPVALILSSVVAAAAYAAYRMPATHAAVGAALAAVPGLAPGSLLDVGGGTGAALWAAAEAYPTLVRAAVLDGSEQALALGLEIASHSTTSLVRQAIWKRSDLSELPGADLATCAYVLGELSVERRQALVAALAASATVVIVEPGTPAGYVRILAARDQLVADGMHVIAPCPHSKVCPLVDDWCHFSVRLNRSAVHRRIKQGSLGHEDEKLSYVVLSREPVAPVTGRVIRHPQKRSGLVELVVCQEGGVQTVKISKRQGSTYKQARHVSWGDPWPLTSP